MGRLIEHAVRHRFGHNQAGDFFDHVLQALNLVDVERRKHVDAGVQQLVDVLVASRMARAELVAVRQPRDRHDRRPARQQGVQVQVVARSRPGRDAFEAFQQRVVFTAVVLQLREDNVDAFAAAALRRFQHRKRLADAGRIAQEDAQPPARACCG